MKIETYWIVFLSPYYNVLKIGYSSLGYKHSKKIKELLSKIAKNRIISEETKLKISENTKGNKNPFFGKTHIKKILQKIQVSNSQGNIYIYDIKKIYSNITLYINVC
jgi:group I intron endonuclease